MKHIYEKQTQLYCFDMYSWPLNNLGFRGINLPEQLKIHV